MNKKQYNKTEMVCLFVRNVFVILAVIMFVVEFFVNLQTRNILKASAYFCGAAAYIIEIFIETDFFTKKVPHSEMFMLYCFGPLYILLGIGYVM